MKQPRGGQKTTARWLAVEQNRPKTVALLLKNGADVDWKDENGKTVKNLPCSD
jgi:ankyrin repeat protein